MKRLAVRARDEAVLERLLAALPDGVAVADEFSLYRPAESLPSEAAIRALVPGAEVTVEPVAHGWETAYHAHVPRVVAGRLAVRPPWVEGEPDDLAIDPGRAFGAGTHATTQLCLELLQDLEPRGALCDWGTGTGVLAIAAARLGWAPVTAVDVEATELGAANAAANGAAVEVRRLDLTREPAPWAPTVVANLTLPLLRAVVMERPPELLVASGLLSSQVAELRAWRIAERRDRDGWAAVVVRPL